MPFVVFFDCESDCTFQSAAGGNRAEAFTRMQATVVCAVVIDTEQCEKGTDRSTALSFAKEKHWWRDEAESGKGPFNELLKLFDEADCIVAFNGIDFDLPLLRKHYGSSKRGMKRYLDHRIKCHDPFVKIRTATDVWFKLDVLLRANGLPTKTGTGLEAIRMWENGEREKLKTYCAQDVRSLVALTLLERLEAPNVGSLPNHVHGITSALAGIKALRAVPVEEEFVIVREERICEGPRRSYAEVAEAAAVR